MGERRVAAVVRVAAGTLAAAGVASPRVDAETLVAHVLGVTRSWLLTAPDLSDEQLADLAELVRRRVAREPLQHLTGTAPFRQLELAVGPGVFVPRPETELLVQWGLRWIAGVPAPVVVDLCAGSGAIALAIAGEHPGSRVHAVEREPAALEWLRRNAAGRPVIVVAGDATDPGTLSTLDGHVDLVLCNPPYVPAGAAAALPAEVVGHDPAAALFAGPDGLDVIRPLVSRVAGLLSPGGAFAIEHDEGQAEAVPALLRAADCFTDIAGHADLAGRARFATAIRA